MYFVFVSIIILILSFLIVEVMFYNKFQVSMICISEAENNIDILLQKKFSLLERTIKIIEDSNKKYKEDTILSNLIKIKNKNISNFDLNKELDKAYVEYRGIVDLDPKLNNIDSINNINLELTHVDNNLVASKKYYNEHIGYYNKLIKSIPSCFIALMFHYKTKDFYSAEKLEIFKILEK